MLALKILGYVLMVSVGIIIFTFASVGVAMCYVMTISEDNCKGCPNYPEHCHRCKVYKHMDDDVKKTWLKEK